MSDMKEKSFESEYPEYYSYYNKIKSNSTTLGKMKEYKPVLGVLETIEWEGESKKAIYDSIKLVESICNDVYTNMEFLANKMKICTGVLYSELTTLKRKIDSYNDAVKNYNKYLDLYNKEKNKPSNNTSAEVS